MLAVFDDVVHNAPISIEKEYVDTNGHRDPQRILVKHNHVACSQAIWFSRWVRSASSGERIALALAL